MNLFEMFKAALKKAIEQPPKRSRWQRKVKGAQKKRAPWLRIVRVGTGKHEPDRSRAKQFRTRPRSARGHWELFVAGKKAKKEMVKVRGKRFVGAV